MSILGTITRDLGACWHVAWPYIDAIPAVLTALAKGGAYSARTTVIVMIILVAAVYLLAKTPARKPARRR